MTQMRTDKKSLQILHLCHPGGLWAVLAFSSISSGPMSDEEPLPLAQYENDSLVAFLPGQWLTCAIDWMSEAGFSR
jgi:hypothetical protein